MRKISLFATVTACLFLLACNAGPNKTNVELIRDMMDQISVKAQDWDPESEDQATAMLPPEHSVAQGKAPYKYAMDPMAAEQNLKNPLGGDMSAEALKMGKETYGIYCLVCHGDVGGGDGPVAEKMALRPPSLLTDKVKSFKDGRIYHIITAGQGVMGSYAGQITDEKKRWAIVNYIRTLQKKSGE